MAKKNFAAAQAVELYIGNYRFDAIRIIETEEYRMSQNHILEKIGVNPVLANGLYEVQNTSNAFPWNKIEVIPTRHISADFDEVS